MGVWGWSTTLRCLSNFNILFPPLWVYHLSFFLVRIMTYLECCSAYKLNISAYPLTFIMIKVMYLDNKGLCFSQHSGQWELNTFIYLEAASYGYFRECKLFHRFSIRDYISGSPVGMAIVNLFRIFFGGWMYYIRHYQLM